MYVTRILVSASIVATFPSSGNLIFLYNVDGTPSNGWNQGLPNSRANVGRISSTVNLTIDSISPTMTVALKVPTTYFLESS